MSIIVYVWNTTETNPGHASLDVGGEYISYWPTKENSDLKDGIKNPPGKGNLKDFKLGVSHRVSFPSGYRVDCRLERKEADHRIELSGLDEGKIKREWRDFKSNPKRYNMQKSNCSTIVAGFLQKGSNVPCSHTPSVKLDDYVDDPKLRIALRLRFIGSTIQMWTPRDVMKYALQIKSVLGG